ncbi:ATP-binding protein [Winogradskyella sp. DF17]|uniref:ATP-binding protein n=1 Tax=Winogradskyella pelagia TaxID=2819984 RepID=A0ABS3T244_9FLAO|nr:ATP-binding protein [Winogradskyella sp. DF17]MBO3116797.1 ATP-binding protein [Winogradskyella sp. DF17]
MIDKIVKNINTLQQLKNNDIHRKYIEYIRYPFFRNLAPDSKITFDFPITFLVGKNGGGKSSTLQSLYGCPKGYSLGDYWFTTELDPIKEFDKNRNCFIYGFKDNGLIKEVIKQRIHRDNDPDYWETAKPIKRYGMQNSQRFSPIEKDVVYLDFRTELSAFDKFFHFLKFHSNTHKTKQDFLRFYSNKLKEAFDTNKIISYYKPNRNKPKVILSKIETKIVSEILRKEFETIEIIEHNLFKDWGTSIRLKQKNINYSEAFAGSGETAVVILVHKIYNASNESLILLDEPETSLHSGAQKRLMSFLIEQCIKKKHQVVISTHSPFLIENMPNESIKVFSTLNTTGKFVIDNDRNYKEAFHELEIENTTKKIILVEDRTAQIIIDKTIEKLGKATEDIFVTKYLPGGADDINQRLTTIMEITDDTYVVFDGDQKKLQSPIDLNSIPPNQQDTSVKLKALIKSQTGCDVKFYLNGGNQSKELKEEETLRLAKKYLEFYKKNVFYLPLLIPEDIIWDEDFAKKLLKLLKPDKDISIIKSASSNSKELLFNFCIQCYGESKQYESTVLQFVSNWLNKEDTHFLNIKNLINQLKN